MSPATLIVDYQAEWPTEFRQIGALLRDSLRETALRIDHIGSTAVPGLAAKDVIDIQVTVADLADHRVVEAMRRTGATIVDAARDHVPPGTALAASELEKRLFVLEYPRRANIHVRELDRFNQQYPLLCRDYLRSHLPAADAYAEIKRQLARHILGDVNAYYDVKDPVFDLIMSAAREWAEWTDWAPEESDA
ncbi:MAG: GrpB family protein [Acidimicrobiales bacterium]